ncbi:MAG: GNAT family N-acetyltransferase [Actinomycetota bacterium]
MDAPLPDGMISRPLTQGDVDDVVAMINACEVHDSGRPMWERADLLADSSTDGFDSERDWVGVFEDGRPVAWGMLVHRRSAWADVHPDARGRGIGAWLLAWTQACGREMGVDRVGQTIDDRRAEVSGMFRDAGYTPRHTSWVLQKDNPRRPPEASFPPGIGVRAFRPGEEDEVLTMFEDAFSEFTDRKPSTLATWRAMTTEREGFAPEDLVLAVHDGQIVGGAFLIDAGDEIWIDKFAVRADHRHRGIARGMLHVAFRRSFERGYDHTSVSTDSRTGALTLYERIGMRVVESFTNWGIDL